MLGRYPATLGVLAHGAAPARLRSGPPDHQAWRLTALTGSPSGSTRPTGRSAALRRVSLRSGTPCSPWSARRRRSGRLVIPALISCRALGARRRDPRPGRLAGTPARPTAPGGWAFEFDNDGYPDTDDTAEVVLALRQVGIPDRPDPSAAAIARATDWLLGMQVRDGGWAAFDADNAKRLVTSCRSATSVKSSTRRRPMSPRTPSRRSPPRTAGEPCGQARSGLAAASAGARWLLVRPLGRELRLRHRCGSTRADRRRGAAGQARHHARGAPGWPIIRTPDGGWGEDLRSYDDPALAGQGTSTAVADRLGAAGAAGRGGGARTARPPRAGDRLAGGHPAGRRGWDEPQFTGTGFPGDFYINYHLYRLVFPLSALGRYLDGPHFGGSA